MSLDVSVGDHLERRGRKKSKISIVAAKVEEIA